MSSRYAAQYVATCQHVRWSEAGCDRTPPAACSDMATRRYAAPYRWYETDVVDLSGQLSNPSPALVQLADQDIGPLLDASPESAGRARLGSARRLKPDEVAALVAGYGAGKTMKELAAEFGISRQTVSTHLRRADTPIRREGIDPEQAAEWGV